jgi:ABC-type phosphate transport system auxiliary subunit
MCYTYLYIVYYIQLKTETIFFNNFRQIIKLLRKQRKKQRKKQRDGSFASLRKMNAKKPHLQSRWDSLFLTVRAEKRFTRRNHLFCNCAATSFTTLTFPVIHKTKIIVASCQCVTLIKRIIHVTAIL